MRLMRVTWTETHSVVIKVDEEKHNDLEYMEDQVKDFAQGLDSVMTLVDVDDTIAEEVTESEIEDEEVVLMEEENESSR